MTDRIHSAAIDAAAYKFNIRWSAENGSSPSRSCLEAAITAYEAAMLRPMEEAPRDGTAILLYIKGTGYVEACFCPGEWSETVEGREYNGAVWSCADDVFQVEIEETPDGYHDGNATHFRPLPTPPQEPKS
jgi:hypothetical protein